MVERTPSAAAGIPARIRSEDDGTSLIEVLVAMMIFAVIFLGVASSTVTAMRMTADTAAREVAAGLAATEIDAVRQLGNPFDVVDARRTTTVDGRTYTIARDTGWVSASGSTDGCSSGTGKLQYKRVNVQVTWEGQAIGNSGARADTILAPKSRLNDPSLGSILISAVTADGTGAPGVGVSVVPTSGGAPLAAQPASTDADGCSYAFLVKPGTYKVTASRVGYIDASQVPTPVVSVTVAAGGAASASFQYDAAATFALDYAPGATPRPDLPSDLGVSFFSSYGTHVLTGSPVSASLHPFPSGYTAVGGRYAPAIPGSAGCVAPDPQAWAEGTVNGKQLAAGLRSDPVAAAGSTLKVPLGVIEVTSATKPLRIKAATAPAAIGDPGCATSPAATHAYSTTPSGTARIAAPFGSWVVEERTGTTTWTRVPAARLKVLTNAAGNIVSTGDVVTVDPRGLRS